MESFLAKIKGSLVKIKAPFYKKEKTPEMESKKEEGIQPDEKEFFDSLAAFIEKEKKGLQPLEEEKVLMEFIKSMRETPKPSIEEPKIKMDIERLKRLQDEEEEIMKGLKETTVIKPRPVKKVREVPHRRKYRWEAEIEELRKKRKRFTAGLLKEEEKVRSKLKKLGQLLAFRRFF